MRLFKSTKLNSKGFGHVELVAALIVVVGVAAIGVRALKESHADTPQQSAAVSTKSEVNPMPSGPAAPSSGWHVDLADSFNAPLGTGPGEDNIWIPATQNGFNSNETEIFNPSQVSVKDGNLRLTAKYDYDVAPADSNNVQRNYVSGLVYTPTNVAGYKGFTWTEGDGSTWAFEIVAKWPPDMNNSLDSGFWSSSANGWVNERDFFETTYWKSPYNIDTDWHYNTYGGLADTYYDQLSYNPSANYHRYTYVIYPNQSWSFYIDGKLQTWVGNDGISTPETSSDVPMELLINYSLVSTTFTSGSKNFDIKSVAVYQDNTHADLATKDTVGGGIAPGTVVK